MTVIPRSINSLRLFNNGSRDTISCPLLYYIYYIRYIIHAKKRSKNGPDLTCIPITPALCLFIWSCLHISDHCFPSLLHCKTQPPAPCFAIDGCHTPTHQSPVLRHYLSLHHHSSHALSHRMPPALYSPINLAVTSLLIGKNRSRIPLKSKHQIFSYFPCLSSLHSCHPRAKAILLHLIVRRKATFQHQTCL